MAVTWDPADKEANITLSNGNLTATASVASANVRATTSRATGGGKYYYELTFVSIASANSSYGYGLTSTGMAGYLIGFQAGSVGSRGANGTTMVDGGGSITVSYTPPTVGSVIGIGIDMGTRIMTLYKNGVASSVQLTTAVAAGTYKPMIGLGIGDSVTANFGASAFVALPSGFVAWDYNPRLARPSISRAANQRPIHFIRL